jgi:WhiB family transcriptional regulator, redox-sensing transcriptional regulator
VVNNMTEIDTPFRVTIPSDAVGSSRAEADRAVPAPSSESQDATESDRPRLVLVANDFDALFQPVEEQWQDRALCAQTDPEAFFPEKGGSTREAKRICLGCEVRDECLEYALANDERFGIWGGLSERERRRLKRGIS